MNMSARLTNYSEARLLFIVTLKITEVRENMFLNLKKSFSLWEILCCCCCLVRPFGTSYAVLPFSNKTKKQKDYWSIIVFSKNDTEIVRATLEWAPQQEVNKINNHRREVK